MPKRARTSADTRHAVFVAAGKKGGHTGVKDPTKARNDYLIQLGADVDDAGQIIAGPGTVKARQRKIVALHLVNAQVNHKAQKARERAEARAARRAEARAQAQKENHTP